MNYSNRSYYNSKKKLPFNLGISNEQWASKSRGLKKIKQNKKITKKVIYAINSFSFEIFKSRNLREEEKNNNNNRKNHDFFFY